MKEIPPQIMAHGNCRQSPAAAKGISLKFGNVSVLSWLVFLVMLILATLVPARAQDGWSLKKAPIMTRWAAEVSPTNALPEYPRPQLVRPDWLNLNGLWDYAVTPETTNQPTQFAGKILVPFAIESALSGVMTNFDEHSQLWYRRSFSVPPAWRGQSVRLHFGAVDWRCVVWVNGQKIGEHSGGYDAFTFDITGALHGQGAEEIALCVTDPTEGDQPRGKQSRKPEGIFYTSTSGIWQTVWLEPVPATCIDSLKLTPDVDANALRLWVAANHFSDTIQVEATALADGKKVASVSGPANATLLLNLPRPHLWSPDDPFLYDLKVTLREGNTVRDTVSSYFGMRKIALRRDDQGVTRIALNDQFIFQLGTLDQGFCPDGIYTAPTDAALRSDIEFVKQIGFNVTRKHVKVEPDRWYYWCDKLGLLVWQDMPSGNNATVDSRHGFENELLRMVEGLGNHPAIVTWVLFNEGWGQYDTAPLARWLKDIDPTRLVDNASGWTDMRAGDMIDMHNYPGPNAPLPEPHRAAVLGETGGFGFVLPDHSWGTNHLWGYVMLTNVSELEARYTQAIKQVWRLHNLGGLSAAIYTQTADVETECDGLLTYDRAVCKMDLNILLDANLGQSSRPPKKIILADALFGRVAWHYTIENPDDDWMKPEFDASNWKEGIGGFGSSGTPGIFLNTSWTTDDIWMRREFTVAADDLHSLKLQLFHDEDAEIYLNGVLALKAGGYITDYDEFNVLPTALAALHEGVNVIAVHCHQTTGGQGIDVGIIVPDTDRAISRPVITP
ncbi:MAG TPA: glycoside hydrolase family 2 TIM barrel-domain containing protein [Verrucomicrobiae bacterium]|jgi:hypothetical protein